jgi:hypothetical protein
VSLTIDGGTHAMDSTGAIGTTMTIDSAYHALDSSGTISVQAVVIPGSSYHTSTSGGSITTVVTVQPDGNYHAMTSGGSITYVGVVQPGNAYHLLTSDGSAVAAGNLDASAPNGGDGGYIETSAPTLSIDPGISVTTLSSEARSGTWLIDPVDFTISNGTAALSVSGIGAATLSASLELGNVSIATVPTGGGNGDIFVNAPVSWAANNKLTLSAHRNIYVNSPITASGASGSVMFEFGLGAVSAGNLSDYHVRAPINLRAGNNFSIRSGSDGSINQFLVVTELGSFGDTSGTTLQGLQPYITASPD